MIRRSSHCQPQRLEALLDSQLTPKDESDLSSHLDHCAACRILLDQMAASPESWQHASAYLRDDSLDESSISSIEGGVPIAPQISQVLDLLQPTDDPAMLGRLGTYEVSAAIGAGGMGVVLKALDRPLDRTVAIKVMAPHLATCGVARQRFAREARAAAAVIHPNIIAIYGVSTDAVLPYLVMPYVSGASLQKRLDRDGALPLADVLRIGAQIAAGLAAAHDSGLVHRDIKPANILLDQGVERLVITDFGLARAADDASMTRTGVIAGTPQFMSPEQARGEAIDARSDLFSLGSLLYACCTGRPPFRADSAMGVLRRITDNTPRPIQEINPAIPMWLCRLIERLHSKSARERYPSAQAVATLLTQCLAHASQPTVHALPAELVLKPPHWRNAKRAWLAVGLVAASLVGGAWYGWQHSAEKLSSQSLHQATDRSAVDKRSTARGDSIEGSTLAPSVGEQIAPLTTERPHAIELQSDFPWARPMGKEGWDDQLDPVMNHVRQSLEKFSE